MSAGAYRYIYKYIYIYQAFRADISLECTGNPYIYTRTCVYACFWVNFYTYTRDIPKNTHVCVCRVQNTYIHIYIHICVPIYTHMVHRILHICIYVYMYTHMCTYIYTRNVPIYAHACLLMHRYRIYIYDTHTYML